MYWFMPMTGRSLRSSRRHLRSLNYLVSNGIGAISTQVLSEFFTIVTRKITLPLTVEDAYTQLQVFIRAWPVLTVTSKVVLEAARGVRDYQINFWDAQLWAAAKMNSIPVILSEDFNTGAIIEGVTFINPFAASFQITEILA